MKQSHFILFLIFFSFLVGFSPVGGGLNTQSLDWQKIELEKSIKQEVHSTISPIIRSGEFIVNVSVKIRPAPPLKAATGGGNDKGGSKDDKKDKDKYQGVRFSDSDPQDAKGDYVVLSKLGLEAPLYNDQAPAPIAKDGSNPAAGEAKSEAQQWQKFISDYVQNYDLFRLIETVNIDVKLDDYLGDETKKTVEELITGMNLEFGNVKVTIKTSYISMKEMKKELDKRKDNTHIEMYKWLGKLGLPAAVILAVLLFGAFSFMLFKKYAALQEKQMEMMREQMTQKIENKDEPKKENGNEDKSGILSGQGQVQDTESDNGIDRFRSIIQADPVEASLMVKRWINDPSKIHQAVLNVLVKELSGEDLSKLFANITLDERKIWKKFIGKVIKAEEILSAKRYIGSQVVAEMIIPNSINDAETVDLLIRINPEESAQFCQEEPRLGAILMTVMNAKFLSRMMDKLPDDIIQQLLQESFKLSSEKISTLLSEFKNKLANHVKTEQISPFMEKLIELIPLSSPHRERSLYEGLANGLPPQKVLELARNYFPSELIFKIPDTLMKSFVQAYPREKRPELVMVLDESVKANFIEIIAPNQKSKDMLALDIEKHERNEILKKKVIDNRDSLMKDFVDHCRKQIRSNPSSIRELEPVLSAWLESFGVNQDEAPTTELASAA